jgi:hypothetical protein
VWSQLFKAAATLFAGTEQAERLHLPFFLIPFVINDSDSDHTFSEIEGQFDGLGKTRAGG